MYIDIEKIDITKTEEGDSHEDVVKYDKVFLAKVSVFTLSFSTPACTYKESWCCHMV
jgi:hypothetical protein